MGLKPISAPTQRPATHKCSTPLPAGHSADGNWLNGIVEFG